MKMKQYKDEFAHLDPQQLALKVDELRRELLTLRLQVATAPAKDFPSRKRTLRRSIACGLTLLQQKNKAHERS